MEDYRNRANSPSELLSEMQMRPTVMPRELEGVRKHETVQKILKKKSNKRSDMGLTSQTSSYVTATDDKVGGHN